MSKRLRILHVASGDLWAGAEVQAFTLMSALARMENTSVAAVLLNDGTMAEKLRVSGIETYVFNERSAGTFLLLCRLMRLISVWRPDVIHTHRVKENVLASVANRLTKNVACVRTVHGGNERAEIAGVRGAVARTIRRTDIFFGKWLQQRIISVSDALGAELAADYGARKIVVIENGVDAEAVIAAAAAGEFRRTEPNSIHVGIVGRLARVKRVDLFLRMAALLRAECPDRRWKFHIFGDGPLRNELTDLSRLVGVNDSVEFHGHRADIAVCIRGLDVLVNCSDHEGLPMTALEAAVLGVPLVAHAVGGLTAVVPREFMVVKHDPEGYRDGVIRALQRDGRDIAASCGASARRRFSAQGNAERTRAMYEEIIAQRKEQRAQWSVAKRRAHRGLGK